MNVHDALYHAVHDQPGGAPALALRMGVASSTLQSMANPNLESHTWSLHRFMQVLALTGDRRPLDALCAQFGGVFVETAPLEAGGDEAVAALLMRLGTEFGDVCREAAAGLSDGRLTGKEYARFKQQVYELQQASAALDALMASKVLHPPMAVVRSGAR